MRLIFAFPLLALLVACTSIPLPFLRQDVPCQNPYFPVTQGTWTYRTSGVYSDTLTTSFTSIHKDGFELQHVYDRGMVAHSHWSCKQGDLIRLIHRENYEGIIATIESQEGLTLPAALKPGTTWTQRSVYRLNIKGDANLSMQGSHNESCKATGTESVSVPAGVFEALRVDCKIQLDINTSLSLAANSSRWLVLGIGTVKQHDVFKSSTGVEVEFEAELLSYKLP